MMKNNTDNPWDILQRETVYDNPWITVHHHDVINPNKLPGIYGVVHFKNIAIGVIPISDDGYTWLIGQYRFPLRRYSWEIPEGGCPASETPVVAAQRELREETGIHAAYFRSLVEDISLSNSITDETGIIFLAECLNFTTPVPDSTEKLQVKKVKIETAIEMCLKGEIHDSLSLIGLLYLRNYPELYQNN